MTETTASKIKRSFCQNFTIKIDLNREEDIVQKSWEVNNDREKNKSQTTCDRARSVSLLLLTSFKIIISKARYSSTRFDKFHVLIKVAREVQKKIARTNL